MTDENLFVDFCQFIYASTLTYALWIIAWQLVFLTLQLENYAKHFLLPEPQLCLN